MDWVHRTDPEWIKARSKYLTASDVKKLLPTTPTGRKRSNVDESYFEVWASKQFVDVMDEQTVSSGMAARGHILEPYAIESFNEYCPFPEMHHWDDVVIHDGTLGWSPDGLSIPQLPSYGVEIEASMIQEPCMGIEIKSYGIEKHLSKVKEHRTKLEERWQIATAMTVMKNLEMMFLVFFNPNCKYPLGWVVFSRQDLASEIEQILEIKDQWTKMDKDFELLICVNGYEQSTMTEQEIRNQCMKKRESVINPN